MRVIVFAVVVSWATLIASGFAGLWLFSACRPLCYHGRNRGDPTRRLCVPSLVAMAWRTLGAKLLAGRSRATVRAMERLGSIHPMRGAVSSLGMVGPVLRRGVRCLAMAV